MNAARKVIPFRPAPKLSGEPLTPEEYEGELELLRGLAYFSWQTAKKSWAEVAADAGVAEETYKNFVYRETKRPHDYTCRRIEQALGLERGYFYNGEVINLKPYRKYVQDAPPKKRRKAKKAARIKVRKKRGK